MLKITEERLRAGIYTFHANLTQRHIIDISESGNSPVLLHSTDFIVASVMGSDYNDEHPVSTKKEKEVRDVVFKLLTKLWEMETIPSSRDRLLNQFNKLLIKNLDYDPPKKYTDKLIEFPENADSLRFWSWSGDAVAPIKHYTNPEPIDDWFGCTIGEIEQQAESFMWEEVSPEYGYEFLDVDENVIPRIIS